MSRKISSVVLAVKIVLLVVGIGWAVYVWLWVKTLAEIGDYLAKTTHTTIAAGTGGDLAALQLYAVAFGPAMLAVALLLLRWPIKQVPAAEKGAVIN